MIHQKRRIKNGFTLVEVLIATAVLAITMLGVSSVVVQANRMGQHNEERKIARNAAQNMTQQIQSKSFSKDQLLTFLNNKSTFSVPGLTPVKGENQVGSISYKTNPDPARNFPVKVNVIMHWQGIMGENTFSTTKIINKSN